MLRASFSSSSRGTLLPQAGSRLFEVLTTFPVFCDKIKIRKDRFFWAHYLRGISTQHGGEGSLVGGGSVTAGREAETD